MAALKGEGERGNWARESARGARGGRKREKSGKGSRFQHPRVPEFLLRLPFLTQATPPPPPFPFPLVKPCIPTSACQTNKLHALSLYINIYRRLHLLTPNKTLHTLEIQLQTFQCNMYTIFGESSYTCSKKVKTQK